MSLTVSRSWEFSHGSRRHKVEFTQSTFSGKRVLVVNGEERYRVSMKYKLTGMVDFVLEGTPAHIAIEAHDYGRLEYTLIVDGKAIPPEGDERVLSSWQVGPHVVEFEHSTFDIFVDTLKVDSMGEFADEGSKYVFTMPDGQPACIAVLPSTRHRVPVTLEVNGREIAETSAMEEPAGK